LLLLIAFAVDKYFEIIQQLREDFQIHSEILLGWDDVLMKTFHIEP